VQAVDGAGNVGEAANKAWYFGPDNYPPLTQALFNPGLPSGENGWDRTPVTITLWAQDEQSGTDYTHYRLNGGMWQTYTAPITITAPGTTTVNYYSVDVAGNTEAIQTATVRIDWMPPASVADAPVSADRGLITVTWVATDTLSGVASVTLWYKFGVDGAWRDSGLLPQSGSSGVFYFPPHGAGTYCFATQATDWAGNAEDRLAGEGDICCESEGGLFDVYLPVVLRYH
jgi:hypothetical protein